MVLPVDKFMRLNARLRRRPFGDDDYVMGRCRKRSVIGQGHHIGPDGRVVKGPNEADEAEVASARRETERAEDHDPPSAPRRRPVRGGS